MKTNKSSREAILFVFSKILEGIDAGKLDAQALLHGLEKLLARKKSFRQSKKARLVERYQNYTWGKVLAYMVTHPGQTLSYEEIFRSAWKEEPDAQALYKRVVWESISQIRRRPDVNSLGSIENVPKKGYVFRPS